MVGFMQTRQTLEQERMSIIEQIDNTAKILELNNQNKTANLEALELIKTQINNRKRIIENIQQSIQLSEKKIASESRKKTNLSQEHETLIRDYNSIVRMSYKKMLTANKMVYLLSASDWDQSWQRLRYSKSIEDHLKRQLLSLNASTLELKKSISSIESEKEEQLLLLESEKKNFAQLEQDEKIKDDILYQLQGDEKRLKGALIKQKRDREELNRAIEKVILTGLKAGENEYEGLSAGQAREIEESRSLFESNRKKLPWPLVNGSIIAEFGKQKHPTLENVFIQNNGIDIVAGTNAIVYAVFDGIVAEVMQIPGSNQLIILKHGEYYSVYSNLHNVFVSKGDSISKGKKIGMLGEDNNMLHLEIWYDKQKLDPSDWIK
jgi:septal ring factor EnvC (AmiA/AmiB activator)